MAGIQTNIDNFGFRITTVVQGVCPRFSYTVGLLDQIGCELVLAGSCIIDVAQIPSIFRIVAKGVIKSQSTYSTEWGELTAKKTTTSWKRALALDAIDYHKHESFELRQIIGKEIKTIDTPNMEMDFVTTDNGSWKYLMRPWPYDIPPCSNVLMDKECLFGSPIITVSRYEVDYWEVTASGSMDQQSKILLMSVLLERYTDLAFICDMELETMMRL